MRLKQLKQIIKEEVKKLQLKEQVIQTNPTSTQGSCALTPNPNGPHPNNFEGTVWHDKWENIFSTRMNNQGLQSACNFYIQKKDAWESTLDTLHNKPHPKCNPKWQNMLHFKLKAAHNIAQPAGC